MSIYGFIVEREGKNDIHSETYHIMRLEDISKKVSGGIEFYVMVSPRSSRSGVEGIDEWRKRLIIKVKAPPLDGKANKEVEEVMKGITGCRSEITVGHTDRQKTVFVEGDPDEIMTKVGESL
jgi:TIGR00251 family protein